MKRLKFYSHLVPLVLSGKKDTTWRFWDDKDLQNGDVVECFIKESGEKFGDVELIRVWEKRLGDLSDEEWDGHEKFKNLEQMYETYSSYYDRKVDENTPVKIAKFRLVE